MICRHCGTEIDTRTQGTNGLVTCPGCGAVYVRRRSAKMQEQDENVIAQSNQTKKSKIPLNEIPNRGSSRSQRANSNRNYVVVVLLVAVLLSCSIAGKGLFKRNQIAGTTESTVNELPTSTSPLIVETISPQATFAPMVVEDVEALPEYSWKRFSYVETTNDGYKIEKYYNFIDSWIDSTDTALVNKVCKELGLSSTPTIDTKHDIFNEQATEKSPHCMFLFGTIQCKNITEGFSITENNAKEVYFGQIGLVQDNDDSISDDQIEWNSVLKLLIGTTNSFHVASNHCFFRDWYGNTNMQIVLRQDASGVVRFVIAVYSPINPNYPQGDKWYQGTKIAVYDYSGDILFEFHPKDM